MKKQEYAIEIRNLTKRYGKYRGVNNLSFFELKLLLLGKHRQEIDVLFDADSFLER